MVVLALIGILTAMILPEMKGTYEDALLRSTARKLVDVFHLASSHAITVNQLHRVWLNTKAGRYHVERERAESRADNELAPAIEVAGGEGDLDIRITIEVRRPDTGPAAERGTGPESIAPLDDGPRKPSQGQAIAFYPDGTAERTEILLRDRQGFRLALQLNPVTARVRILELERQ